MHNTVRVLTNLYLLKAVSADQYYCWRQTVYSVKRHVRSRCQSSSELLSNIVILHCCMQSRQECLTKWYANVVIYLLNQAYQVC